MDKQKSNDSNSLYMSNADYFLGRVPKQYRQQYHEVKLDTNINRTFAFSIYIITLQIVLNVLNIIKPEGEGNPEGDIAKYVTLSLFMICIGFIYLFLSILIKRKMINNRFIKNALPYSLLYIYVFVQLIFLSFNMEVEQSFNSYIIAIIITSFFIITSPAESVGIIAVAFSVTLIMSVYANKEGIYLALVTDTWANVLIITLLCAYMSIVVHNMYIRNFLTKTKLKESNEKLTVMASTDALTGVYNRRGFFEYLDREIDRTIVKEGVFSIAMIDVDYFKKYNDRNGHLEGDACLLKIAQTLKIQLEEVGGSICRYGGEEFLGIFDTKDIEGAKETAEICRKAVESRNMIGKRSETEQVSPITISIGVAYAVSGTQIQIDKMIKRADENLYKAKSGGRNRVIL